MRQNCLPFLVLFGASFFTACVSSKVYRAELSMREQCEARERVLVNEQLERRKETAELVKQVGDLNRTIGNQEAVVRDLEAELTSRTLQLGESSSKLVSEKSELQKELAGKNARLNQCEAVLGSVSTAQKKQRKTLEDLRSALQRAYPAGVSLEIGDQAVSATLADNSLFDAGGLTVSAAGKNLLTPLANYLATHPELDMEVLAHTDNQLPKGAKNLNDTWDWSLQRATNVVRLLVSEFNINANQLTPVGKGEFYPVSSNETADGRHRNRRTILLIYPPLSKVPSVE